MIQIEYPKEIKGLEELCKPIVEYLKKNYDPHCMVIIKEYNIELVRSEIGIPIKEGDTN